ncbi:MAG: isoleucine--tRNA ligase, partial [Exiguobacterium sp.]|nr:isoleucine--tRNA ligase [Exiguobacterium sp.]
MKYRAGERRKAIEYEKAIADWWKKNHVFEKSVEQRPIDKSYVFYDGPPFITGNPHHGTLLSSIVKDAVPRFWTMNGYRVERRWGWDCHGLPAENFVEKQLGITDRREIGTKWSLEDYIKKARESMVANSETWRATIDRVGRWVDFDNCYRTMNKDYMESVWWAFKKLYEAGKIYEGRKVLMYDTKFATPVSKAEVTMDNDAYQNVTDPSAYVKFKLLDSENSLSRGIRDDESRRSEESRNDGRDEAPRERASSESTYLLAWTTTPWTLPANLALAVNPDLDYGVFDIDSEKYIVSLERAKVLFEGKKPEKAFKGTALVGKKYEPIIKVADGLFDLGLRGDKGTVLRKDTYTVLPGDFVSAEDGTGIVHIAPAYGEDDYALAQQYELDFVDCLDENGYYLPEMAEELHALGVRDTDENGIQVWAGNKYIAKCLEEKGIIYKIDYIQHEYPFNPRSKERIIYRAFPSWFFDIEGQKPLMLAENEHINWFPSYLKHGRFAKNIEAAPDWNLSRDRFWATAMPVWKGDKGTVKVVGSYEELKELSGKELEDYHRPWVDEIEFDIDGEHFTRIEKVLDCWFESGSMPFAQMHYPFENKKKFEANYPADFIVEYVGQVRAWFYYVHAVNTALAEIGAFGDKAKKGAKNAYKNVITTGTLAGNDGRKMSKSLGNYTDPNILMDQYSADALRFLLLSSPVLSGEDFALLDKDVSDVNRKLAMIWNVYDFFTTYAEIDQVDSKDLTNAICETVRDNGSELSEEPHNDGRDEASRAKSIVRSPLDTWIISRIYQLRNEITAGMEEYNIPKALENVLLFIDDLSNWFVRRSRRRFSKNDDTADKNSAY